MSCAPFVVPGRDACEITMVHQEDAGLNAEMAKLAFSKGIWSYICKMDAALRKYSSVSHDGLSSTLSAVKLVQKVGLFVVLSFCHALRVFHYISFFSNPDFRMLFLVFLYDSFSTQIFGLKCLHVLDMLRLFFALVYKNFSFAPVNPLALIFAAANFFC